MYYVYMPDNTINPQISADRLLRSLGATRRLSGFDYAVYMIEQVAGSQGEVHLITKRLYPDTAKYFDVTPRSVERALRTLIGFCWENGDRDAMNNVAGCMLKQPPSNSDFIDMMAAYIKAAS